MPTWTPESTRDALVLLSAALSLLVTSTLGGTEVITEPPRLLSTREVEIHFETPVRGAAEVIEYILFYTVDGGQSWVRYPKRHRGPSPFLFEAPSDGHYGLLLIARDALGFGEREPQPGETPERQVVVDSTPPMITVERPIDGERSWVSGPIEVKWKVQDSHLEEHPVEIMHSLDGAPWQRLWAGAPGEGRRTWTPPTPKSGQVRFRFRARDQAGHVAEKTVRLELFNPPEAPAMHPSVKFLSVAPSSSRLTVPVHYRFTDEEAVPLAADRLRGVRLWYRSTPGKWQDGGLDPDRTSPIQFQAPGDGHYDLLLIAEDVDGVTHPRGIDLSLTAAPSAALTRHGAVLIDTLEPRIKIVEPVAGSRLAGPVLRGRFVVEEENHLEKSPEVRYSLDGAKTWMPLHAAVTLTEVTPGQLYAGEFEFQRPLVHGAGLGLLLSISQTDGVGNVGHSMTDPDEPIQMLEASPRSRQEALESYRRALVLLSQPVPERQKESLELFEAALKQWEPMAELHHDYAVALEWTSTGSDIPPAIVRHYRRALELDPENSAIRVSLIRHLLRLCKRENLEPGQAQSWQQEARKEFAKVDWPALLAPDAGEAEERLQRLRRTYRKWKEEEFADKEIR